MTSSRTWYVVHTRPQAETTAARHLARQGFQIFLPLLSRRRRHARKVETVRRPLFPRYVFVALDLGGERWRPVRSTIGVADLVGNGEQPTPVPFGIVEALQSDCGADGVLRTEETYARGDRVRILAGTFADLEGTFECMTAAERVAVLLKLLGRSVRVSLPVEALERAV